MFEYFISIYTAYLRKCYKYKLKKNSFDLSDVDFKIDVLASIINIVFNLKKKRNHSLDIGVFASALYDVGGHTECIKAMVESLGDEYDIKLFLSQNRTSVKKAFNKLEVISSKCKVDGLNEDKNFTNSVIELYNKIIISNPRCAFVFIHPRDLVFSTVLSLLKKNTNIKIIFYNHASHYPALSFNISDLILEGMPVTHYVTNKYRRINKCYVFGLQNLHKSKTIYLNDNEIIAQKALMGIGSQSFLTVTGCVSYKLFDGENSEYFNMIKRLLVREPKLEHIVITKLSSSERNIVENIFHDSSIRKRLHFLDFTPNFDPIFQSCDVFIDSFPVSSAMTQIDLMRNKKPTVVKINENNSLLSFHEYMPKDYIYMFSQVTDMENAVAALIHDKEERLRISKILYDHYLKNYEANVVKSKYEKIIKSLENLDSFYQDLPKNNNYNFEISLKNCFNKFRIW